MKIPQHRRSAMLVLGLAAALVLLNAVFGIPSKEGFNPSDDGVILAQSYRILQGEIPHRDFISIRPVGSAVMHLVHFISPLPLELSARWMTLAEYFLYSLLISLIVIRSWFHDKPVSQRNRLLAGSVLFMFLLNENHYNLFPWTTIDALFWFSLGFYGWHRWRNSGAKPAWIWIFLVFWGITSAALSRQTFALPGVIFGILAVVRLFRQREPGPGTRIAAAAAGLLPGFAYAGMITLTGSWHEFTRQMTGRTEFRETGIVKFLDNFWQTPVWILFILVFISGMVVIWNRERSHSGIGNSKVPALFAWLAGAIITCLSAGVFILPDHLFNISFSLFWMLVLLVILVYLKEGAYPPSVEPALWILLVSWTSALSLGDNAPVFTTGLLAGTGILMVINYFPVGFSASWSRVMNYSAGAGLVVLLGLSMVVQKRVNYRDLPSRELTGELGDIFPGLKGIKSGPQMHQYLSEIRRIYQKLGSPEGRFAVWPNNALIYTLLDSPNPFPLDWMQAAEFAGNEERLLRDAEQVLKSAGIFVLVERNNVKWISSGAIALDKASVDYPYLVLLDRYAEETDVESPWFEVYCTK